MKHKRFSVSIECALDCRAMACSWSVTLRQYLLVVVICPPVSLMALLTLLLPSFLPSFAFAL